MDDSNRIMVTGGSGFIGRHLQRSLIEEGHVVVATSRRDGPQSVNVGELGPNTDWSEALVGVDAVVHLAGRVHVTSDKAADPVAAFRTVNVVGTERLARAAAQAEVKRFVFLSTVGIVGSCAREKVDEMTPAHPANSYAVSKLEAEQELQIVGAETDLEVTILRVPLVYGPGAPGNLTRLRSLVEKGIPIPLGAVENRRSAIAVENLASAITAALESPAAANCTLYVEDGTVWSSPQMADQIGRTIGRPARLVSVPVPVLRSTLKLTGRRDLLDRLLGSLVVDGSAFRSATGWSPPLPADEALARGVV